MGTELQLVGAVEDEVLVEDSLFTLRLISRSEPDWDIAIPSRDQVMVTDGSRLIMRSGAQDNYPLVRLEHWSNEPDIPGDAANWDASPQVDLEVAVTPTALQLAPLTSRMPDVNIELERTGWYRFRAFVTGRQEAFEHPFPEEGFPHSIERWIIQAWPLDQP